MRLRPMISGGEPGGAKDLGRAAPLMAEGGEQADELGVVLDAPVTHPAYGGQAVQIVDGCLGDVLSHLTPVGV